MKASKEIKLTQLPSEIRNIKILDYFYDLEVGEKLIIHADHHPILLLGYLSSQLRDICTFNVVQTDDYVWTIELIKNAEPKLEKTLASIVMRNWKAAEVFEKYDINYYSEGNKELDRVCEEKGIDPEKLKKELINLKEIDIYSNYNSWGVKYLVEFLYDLQNKFLGNELDLMTNLAHKVTATDGTNHPEFILAANKTDEFIGELGKNIRMTRDIFPFIRKLAELNENKKREEELDFKGLDDMIKVINNGNKQLEEEFNIIKNLNNNFKIKAPASTTLQKFYEVLKDFEKELHKYIYIETNVLFPKSISLAKKVLGLDDSTKKESSKSADKEEKTLYN